jgi:hypothetical protein
VKLTAQDSEHFQWVDVILIIKANKVHSFSSLFDKVLYMFDKYVLPVYSVEILLMMDSGPVQNM